ncbi:restriction system protein [Ereboglobus sp. PH5-10]|uniref:four helix bundle suffix domain-containing protein n=1 Tax=Ereboglobus sp. PH5-10 TaxID=2940629 RepID=UPI0024050012|nr:four helix bundle suffix domain-containing protein [Ereboglobus sp. PH5-10]MDF9828220.1 restriction system protein [Ereboglobus sp. PH5-10]
MPAQTPAPIIRPHGGYRTLRAHQVATLIYDNTYWFCERHIRRDDARLRDQMVHAARSGRQNIAEGSRRAGTSNTTEIRLIDVARASLEELLNDYEDYLRQHRLPEWNKDHPEALRIRRVHNTATLPTDDDFRHRYRESQDALNALYSRWLENDDPAIRANALICLIHQANYLLDQLLKELGENFVEQGGFTEHLATLRADHRANAMPTAKSASADAPNCPQCGQPMRQRTASKGRNVGKPFWGCTAYPTCKGTLEIPSTPSPKST